MTPEEMALLGRQTARPVNPFEGQDPGSINDPFPGFQQGFQQQYERGEGGGLRPVPGGARGPGITQQHPDSYGSLLNSIKGGRSGQGVLEDLLGQYEGDPMGLKDFMSSPAFRTIMAFAGKNTPEFQKLQNLKDPTLQSMNVGLGQISAAGARGVQESVSALNAAGMGRNAGAMAAAKMGGQMDVAGRSAGFQAAMQQQAHQNELARLGTLIDMEQEMAQLALGFQPQPRQPKSGASAGDWMALAGTLIGGIAGGPIGAAIGGGLGGAAGKSRQQQYVDDR